MTPPTPLDPLVNKFGAACDSIEQTHQITGDFGNKKHRPLMVDVWRCSILTTFHALILGAARVLILHPVRILYRPCLFGYNVWYAPGMAKLGKFYYA